MRFVMLIYSNPVRWAHPMYLQQPGQTDSDRSELTADLDQLLAELRESGEYAGGERLAEPAAATTVRVRNGEVTATDGPYAEAKEHLAGYLLLECQSSDRAEQIAARFPDARYAAVELRPVVTS